MSKYILRNLKYSDSERMYNWMLDFGIVSNLSSKFDSPTLKKCKDFILNSSKDKYNFHLAIADESNIYKGTVSLKNLKDNIAEFAIVLCADAIGKGYSSFAIKEIIKKGFKELKLNTIYWSVKKENVRAIKFYNKNEYKMFNILENEKLMKHATGGGYKSSDFLNLLWYKVDILEYKNSES